MSDYQTISEMVIWYSIPVLPPTFPFFLLQPRFLRDSGGGTKGLLFVKKSAGAAYIELGISIDDITATH